MDYPHRVNDGYARSWWGRAILGCVRNRTNLVAGALTPPLAYFKGAKQIPFRELAQVRIAADQLVDDKVPGLTGGALYYLRDDHAKGANLLGDGGYSNLKAGSPRFLQGRAISPALSWAVQQN